MLKTGTGSFISPDGELLTNYHVISGGSLIMAKMPNGAVFFLKSIVTTSETYDGAKLQFVATDVSYLTLGSSSSAAEGQRILVIGNSRRLGGHAIRRHIVREMNRTDFQDAVSLIAQLREHRLLLFGQDRDTSQFRRLINDFRTDWFARGRCGQRIKRPTKKLETIPTPPQIVRNSLRLGREEAWVMMSRCMSLLGLPSSSEKIRIKSWTGIVSLTVLVQRVEARFPDKQKRLHNSRRSDHLACIFRQKNCTAAVLFSRICPFSLPGRRPPTKRNRTQIIITKTKMQRLLPLFLSLVIASIVHAQSGNAILHGSAPAWANSKNYAGPVDPNAEIGFRVYLGWNNPTAAVALAQAVSDPDSSSYRQYLTPEQFRRRFAPSHAQVAAVQSWLESQGFTLNYTPKNNHYVSAQGTVGQAQAAFATQFALYNVKGKTVRSPSADVAIPSSFASIIAGVVGLDESAVFVQPDHVVDTDAPPSAGFRNASPLSVYWAQLLSSYSFPAGFTGLALSSVPWTLKGYTPEQIKGAYGISGFDGAGQTVAIIDAYASPTIFQDVNQWSTNHGLPTMNGSQFVQVVPPGIYNKPENRKQDPQGWYGEETLDVESVHGMAPGAKIVFVGAPNNYQDLDAAMNHVVDEHLAQIVTNSYGFTSELLHPGFVKPFEDTLIQAAIEGIGVYFSSGDSGDGTSVNGFATPQWPASSPWVTAVGGTSLGISSTNTRVIETGWGTSTYNSDPTTLVSTRTGWLYGAGGGVSKIFAEPFYQTSAGLKFSGRGVPDVAALADPQTGFLVGQTQTFPNGTYYDEYRVGGTSLASPIFAGLMALADQAAGHAHGFANPLFYANPSAFYDVVSVKTAVARKNYVNGVDATNGTVDRLRTFDDYSGSPTQQTNPGWDNVTGLGTPGNPSKPFLSTFGK